MTRKRRLQTDWLPLATARLVLREFREADFEDIHAYGADPEVSRFMPWGPNTPDDTRAFLGRMAQAQASPDRASVNAAIELAAENRVIGSVELRVLDSATRTGEVGYCIGRPYWGQGFVVEAATAMIGQGFETLRLRRIIATCNARNVRSWRVMHKLGMRREGHFLKDVKARRGWRDSFLYALLAEEWRAQAGR